MAQHRLLVVDDDADDLKTTQTHLANQGYEIEVARSGAEAIAIVQREPERFAVIVLDFQMQDLNGAEVTRKLKALNPDLFILIFSGEKDQNAFILPLRQGACAFVSKGESIAVFTEELRKLVKRYEEEGPISQIRTREDAEKLVASVGMVGHSKNLARAVEKLLRVQGKLGSVLLLGETGTGKELAAKSLHQGLSGSFVAVNCGDFSLAKDLARSELYGHVKGAYTGASEDKKGVFELAEGGTSFLDEFHNMHLDIQKGVLRILENKEVKRLGGQKEIPISCRIVAGASPELFEMIPNGSFREDLFQRVSETIIRIPSLSERREDIPLLIEHFCKLWCEETGIIKTFPIETLPILEGLPWRGNVRELRNVVRSTLNLSHGHKVRVSELEDVLDERRIKPKEKPAGGAIKEELDAQKKAFVIRLLARSTSLRDAARKTGVAPSTLSRFVVKHGINLKAVLGRDLEGTSCNGVTS